MQRFNVALNVNHRAIVSRYRRTSVPSSQCPDAASGQFVLSSVGWNETDDDGEAGLKKDGPVDINQDGWVWRDPARRIFDLRAAWKSGSGS